MTVPQTWYRLCNGERAQGKPLQTKPYPRANHTPCGTEGEPLGMKETMKQTNTTSSIISLRSYFGVGLIMTGLLAGGCLSGEKLEPSEEVGSVESAHWLSRAVCDSIACPNPDASAAECSNVWSGSSNKTYSVWSLCDRDGTTTNSDCYSDCFRNHCQCDSLAGKPNACPGDAGADAGAGAGKAAVETVDTNLSVTRSVGGYECVCGVADGAVGHRYWCCGTESDTIQAYSDEDHCDDATGGGGAGDEAGSGVGGTGGAGATSSK